MAGGMEADVVFSSPDPAMGGTVDTEYHQKYDRYDSAIVGHVTNSKASAATIRLVKSDTEEFEVCR